MQFKSPRVNGVREHLERGQFFLELAGKCKDTKASYRLMLAAVYSCRAIIELMLEAAEKQEVKNLKDPDPKVNRDALESQIAPKLPYYALIERIRIHDFHRFGLLPPDPNFRQNLFLGPTKLTAQKGAAAVNVTALGPQVSTTGSSQVKFQRPLLVQDGDFFDDDSGIYVKLEEVLKTFLTKACDVLAEFEKLVT